MGFCIEVEFEVEGCDPEELLLPSPAFPDDAPPDEEPPDAGGTAPDEPVDPPLLTSPDESLFALSSLFPEDVTDEGGVGGEFEGDPAA